MRTPLKVDVIRDRGALGREVEDGQIENVYRLQIMNTDEHPHEYQIKVDGIKGIAIVDDKIVHVDSTGSRAVAIRVRVPHGQGHPGSNKIHFEIEAVDARELEVKEKAAFFVPR
jgi:polyferredoxin